MVFLLALIAAPGILALVNATPIPIRIVPGPQHVTFNFFAPDNSSGFYTPEICAELDEHHVNLDLAMSLTNSSVKFLKELEDAMPNITYRISITPHRINKLTETVRQKTVLMRTCEENTTLDQWRGFFFDVEGEAYRWSEVYPSIEESIAEWNTMFNYIEAESIIRGYLIETESVSSDEFAIDMAYDGDADMQALEGYNSFIPARFTTYAPTIYRALEDDGECNQPWSITDPWFTSYFVYSRLYTLSSTIPESQRGIYLGVTNCSGYSRDLSQPELVSWGEPTGFGNLIRDTLIGKSFGLTEVTYFLLWDPAGLDYGGFFSSYGIDALDRLNQAVNINPPASFDIYFSARDADISAKIGHDFICDLSDPTGFAFIVFTWVAAALLAFLLLRARKPKIES